MGFWVDFFFIIILFNPSNTGKIKKIDLWDASNYTKFKYQ